ncbi:MAG TPA: S4 domain-containing protein [Spirochaetota bacterium]|nr:S4 domain-containing protein [Spirochaetota bacterium]
MSKNRLDQYLLQNKICVSREKARNLILAGCVSVNGQIVLKPSFIINENDNIILLQASQRFVSRGGEKLQRALDIFDINISNRIVLD